MATPDVLGASRGRDPDTATRRDAGMALQLSVETAPGVGNAQLVVVRANAFVDHARLNTTLALHPDAALDLAMRLVGCVGRLRKLEIGETRSGR
jgi:hypothetical protein